MVTMPREFESFLHCLSSSSWYILSVVVVSCSGQYVRARQTSAGDEGTGNDILWTHIEVARVYEQYAS